MLPHVLTSDSSLRPDTALGQNEGDHGGHGKSNAQQDEVDQAAESELKERGKPVLAIDAANRDEQLDHAPRNPKRCRSTAVSAVDLRARRKPSPMMIRVLRKTKAWVWRAKMRCST